MREGDRRFGWNGSGRVSSFYFSRFAEDAYEPELWKIFKRWGKVCNLYIDRKRDKNGYRYGFARFVGIQNDLDFSRKLDAINAGSMKLHVNIPRFAIVGGLGAEKKEREYAEKEKGNKLRKKNLKEERWILGDHMQRW